MSRTVPVAGAGKVPFTEPGTGARYDVPAPLHAATAGPAERQGCPT
jgi:hypothetical protein